MSVPYDGADAQTLQDVVAWLTGSQAVAAWAGKQDPDEVAAIITEIDGDAGEGAAITVDTPVLSFQRTPGGGHDGTAEVAVAFTRPTVDGDTPAEQHRRELIDIAGIRRAAIHHFEQRLVDIAVDPPVVLDPSAGRPEEIEWEMRLVLEVSP